jgi:hypothetical protein
MIESTNVDGFLAALVTVFALAMFIISFAAYRRFPNPRILPVSMAFCLFLVKGIVLSLAIFMSFDYLFTASILLDALILLLLSFSVLRRQVPE